MRLWYSQNEKLYRNENEQTATHTSMTESQKHIVEWKKLDHTHTVRILPRSVSIYKVQK